MTDAEPLTPVKTLSETRLRIRLNATDMERLEMMRELLDLPSWLAVVRFSLNLTAAGLGLEDGVAVGATEDQVSTKSGE